MPNDPATSLLGPIPEELVLRVCGTAHDGRLVRIRSERCLVGSGPDSDLRLQGESVRPIHCFLLRGLHGLVVRACSGDVRVNDEPVVDALLKPWDRLGIGCVELEVVGEDEAPNDGEVAELRRELQDLQDELDRTHDAAASAEAEWRAERERFTAEYEELRQQLDARHEAYAKLEEQLQETIEAVEEASCADSELDAQADSPRTDVLTSIAPVKDVAIAAASPATAHSAVESQPQAADDPDGWLLEQTVELQKHIDVASSRVDEPTAESTATAPEPTPNYVEVRQPARPQSPPSIQPPRSTDRRLSFASSAFKTDATRVAPATKPASVERPVPPTSPPEQPASAPQPTVAALATPMHLPAAEPSPTAHPPADEPASTTPTSAMPTSYLEDEVSEDEAESIEEYINGLLSSMHAPQ